MPYLAVWNRRAGDALARTWGGNSVSHSAETEVQQPSEPSNPMEYAANYAATMVDPPAQVVLILIRTHGCQVIECCMHAPSLRSSLASVE